MNKAGKVTKRFAFLFAAAMVLLLTQHAQAHILAGESGGFWSGLKHPWSGWDHICAMVAVGLWGAELGMPAIWILPVTFPVIMAIGGFLGLIGFHIPGDEIGIAASAIVLGLMVMLNAKPPLAVAMIIVGIFGLFHGYAHGRELPPGQSGMLYSIGFVVATGTLHACGISLGLIHRWKSGQAVVRVMGGVIAVAGVIFLVDPSSADIFKAPEPAPTTSTVTIVHFPSAIVA